MLLTGCWVIAHCCLLWFNDAIMERQQEKEVVWCRKLRAQGINEFDSRWCEEPASRNWAWLGFAEEE